MPAPTPHANDPYDSDTTVPHRPSPPPATPSSYCLQYTNPAHQPVYSYHPPTSTQKNHPPIRHTTNTSPYFPTPLSHSPAPPYHTNNSWPEEAFVYQATDFPFQRLGSQADDKMRFVDYNIPIEIFYGREYRQMQRWVVEGQVSNVNEGVRWNWPPAETGVEVHGAKGGEMRDHGQGLHLGGVADVGLNTRCRAGEGLEKLGPKAQAMKRKAEELLDSVEGRRRIGRPGKKPKGGKGKCEGAKGKVKDAVLGCGPGGLFGNREDQDLVDQEELYKRCMAMLGE